jgi:WD40 repeat protein
LGAGVVVNQYEVLTCAHVVIDEWRKRPLWVRFPKAGVSRRERRNIRDIRLPRPDTDTDVVALILDEPVPDVVIPAPLRTPAPMDLVGEDWWAFGFPDGAEHGSEAHGVVGGALAWGWLSLHRRSRDPIRTGFSGAGLWSPQYEAVVGLVGEARVGGDYAGDGRAITMHQIEQDLPTGAAGALPTAWSLPDADDSALAAWGWSLDRDAEAKRHWRPRARGVSVESEQGYRFSGRTTALTDIVSWLTRAKPDRRVLVVTGSPGVGKSAVLGRIVTTADAGILAALPSTDRYVKAPLGSVACAIHAKGKTALDVAVELARAASVRLPREVEDLVPALREALVRRSNGRRRFNIVVDALDEAASPAQVRQMLSTVLFPIAQTCSDVGAQVVVGTRRRDDGGDLLAEFGPAGLVLDLDEERYFAEEDLAAYALATLQLLGDEREGNPYGDEVVAQPVARRIAALAQRNFLIAGLVARTHGSYDIEPIDPQELTFTPTVDAALADYLRRLAPVGGVPAMLVLTALAYATGQGFSLDVWSVALHSMAASIPRDMLLRFTHSAAANFLVEVSHEAGIRRFRLFHQALNDALLRERQRQGARPTDDRNMTQRLIEYGRRSGWDKADSYLRRSLPLHASRAGMVDALLLDDDYLLYADLQRLMPLADDAGTDAGRARGRLLRLTPRAISADPDDRTALLDLTQRMERLGGSFAANHSAPYRVRWAEVARRTERAALEGHANRVTAVCPVVSDGKTLLASASDDWTIRLWDAATGGQENVLRGHTRGVVAVCMLPVGERQMLVSLGDDATARVWDPLSPQEQQRVRFDGPDPSAICSLTFDGRTALAIGDNNGSVALWSPETRKVSTIVAGRSEPGTRITHMCSVPLFKGNHLACADAGGNVFLWDPVRRKDVGRLRLPTSELLSLFAVEVRTDVRLVAGCADGAVRIWTWLGGSSRQDPHDSQIGGLTAICPVDLNGETVLASGDEAGAVKLWKMPRNKWTDVSIDRLAGTQSGRVTALCSFALHGRTYLASAGEDRTVRLWDPSTGREESGLTDRAVRSLCRLPLPGKPLVAGITPDTVRLWDGETGERLRRFQGSSATLLRLSPVPAHFVAAGGVDGTIRVWDVTTGQPARMPLATHTGSVTAVCRVSVQGQTRLASAGSDGWVRLWDIEKGRVATVGASLRRPRGNPVKMPAHHGRATAITTVSVDGRTYLATVGDDRVLRLWDLDSPRFDIAVGEIDLGRRHNPTAICTVSFQGRPALATAGHDGAIRLWDPTTGKCSAVLNGHSAPVNDLCRVDSLGRPMLASASADRTVRLWNLNSALSMLAVPVYHAALACVESARLLIVGLTAGIVAIDISRDRRAPGIEGRRRG